MRLKITTHHLDGYEPFVEVEHQETDQDLLGSVSKFNDMTRDELQSRIDTGKWYGGRFIQETNRITFKSDVVDVIFSLVE